MIASTVRVTMVGVVAAATLAAQSPTLDEVLARAAEYHAAYVTKISGVTFEEQMQLRDVSGGRMQSVVRIDSDVVLVNLSKEVTALRDPFAVDTQPLRPKAPRILNLLGAPATPSVKDWNTASSYTSQNVVYFLLDIVVKVNEPTLALRFISRAAQPGLKYKLDGRKKMNNVQVVGVRFEEPEGSDREYALKTRSNARATGRFWIDPLTGAIHQTELWVDSKLESAIVSVKYAPHRELGFLLPTEMIDSYEERQGGGGPRQMGSGADPSTSVQSRVSIEARSYYSKARFAAIDLTKLK